MQDHTARGGLGPKGREALIPTSATGIVAQGVFRFDDTYSVRVLGTPDEPEFVAADVSGPLGYRMASDMTRRLDDDEKGTRSVRTPSGDQQMTVLTEAGLYAAILGSKSPTAKPFKRWVTHTVLPAIRRTGSYGAQPALHGPELVAAALIEANQMLEAKDARIEQQAQQLEAQAPKVSYVDTYVADSDLLSFSTVASANRITEKRLREVLIEKDWIYVQTDSRWSDRAGKKVTRNRYSEKASTGGEAS